MLLSDFIKELVNIATDVGECEVYVTTERETQMYNTVLLHYLPFKDKNVLRIEGITGDKNGASSN